MSAEATPFINSAMLGEYAGRTVRVMGQVVKPARGDTVTLKSTDEGVIEVDITPDSMLSEYEYAEIIGKVSSSGDKVREFSSIAMQGPPDMKLANHLAEFEKRFPNIFGPP